MKQILTGQFCILYQKAYRIARIKHLIFVSQTAKQAEDAASDTDRAVRVTTPGDLVSPGFTISKKA